MSPGHGCTVRGTVHLINHFNTAELKDPLIEAAHRDSWGWRGVAFGKL